MEVAPKEQIVALSLSIMGRYAAETGPVATMQG
jgi:hypothetical protein